MRAFARRLVRLEHRVVTSAAETERSRQTREWVERMRRQRGLDPYTREEIAALRECPLLTSSEIGALFTSQMRRPKNNCRARREALTSYGAEIAATSFIPFGQFD